MNLSYTFEDFCKTLFIEKKLNDENIGDNSILVNRIVELCYSKYLEIVGKSYIYYHNTKTSQFDDIKIYFDSYSYWNKNIFNHFIDLTIESFEDAKFKQLFKSKRDYLDHCETITKDNFYEY